MGVPGARAGAPDVLELQTAVVRLAGERARVRNDTLSAALAAPGARGRAAAPAAFELELVATVHVAEPAYYEALAADVSSRHRVALYELIVDGALTEPAPLPSAPRGAEAEQERNEGEPAAPGAADAPAAPLRRLAARLRPTDEQRRLAARHGLTPQLDALDFAALGADGAWCLADLDRETVETLQRADSTMSTDQ